MKSYYVFNHPKYGEKIEHNGFSFLAMLFPVFWFLFKRMYGYSFLVFIAMAIIPLLDSSYMNKNGYESVNLYLLSGLGLLALQVLIGIKARTWLIKHLEDRGFEQVAYIDAKNIDAAIAILDKERKRVKITESNEIDIIRVVRTVENPLEPQFIALYEQHVDSNSSKVTDSMHRTYRALNEGQKIRSIVLETAIENLTKK